MLRVDLQGQPTGREVLRQVSQACKEAPSAVIEPHQTLPFQAMFIYRTEQERGSRRNEDGARGQLDLGAVMNGLVARVDLSLLVDERDNGLFASLLYNPDLFEAATVRRMAGHFETLLAGMVANPTQPISESPLLTEAEREQLLVGWNDTEMDYPKDSCYHQLFEAQVRRTPDAVAVVFGKQSLTYRELNARSNQLAHYLQELGVGPEVLVGICVKRDLSMVVGLLGILKAGGAYVPLDPAYPKQRIAFMLKDAKVSVLLTQEQLVPDLLKVDAAQKAQLVCLDADWGAIARNSAENPICLSKPTNLAYVLYTSGSTGRPKGVAIEHHSPGALLDWAQGVFTPDSLAGVLASTSICFDLSVFELFLPLSSGGTVILAENALHLPSLPAKNKVTLINTVPSAITELVRMGGVPASVQVVNLAGEPLKESLVEQIYRQETIQKVYNLWLFGNLRQT